MSLFDSVFSEMVWERPKSFADMNQIIAYISLDSILYEFCSEPAGLFELANKALEENLPNCTYEQIKIIAALVDEIVEYKYNYVSIYCSGPSELEVIIEDSEYNERLFEDHISVLNNIMSLFEMTEMPATRSTLAELKNKSYT